jgi:DNA-binding transcriptional LysR family regulator
MDRFRTIQVFVRVVDEGSFAAAARSLAMSPPSVTRAISLLEDHMGTRLLNRTTRSLRLTDSGQRFVQDARQILLDLEEAEAAAIGSHSAPRGDLRVTAPALFGRMFVTPILGDFLDEHPLVTCQTLYADRVVDMMEEGQDVAIRIGNLPDSSHAALRVGSVRRVLFASLEYIEEYGMPQHPGDLENHRFIQPVAMNAANEWTFYEGGKQIMTKLKSRLRMNSNDAVIELALQGWGLSCLLSYQIAPYLEDGRLKTLLGSFEPAPLPIHILHQEGRMVSAKVRAFVDYMAKRLRADPALN